MDVKEFIKRYISNKLVAHCIASKADLFFKIFPIQSLDVTWNNLFPVFSTDDASILFLRLLGSVFKFQLENVGNRWINEKINNNNNKQQ